MARARKRGGAPSRARSLDLAATVCRIGPLAVTALAAVFAFRRIDDFDTWWHLATGRWIVLHRAVPAGDVLSHTVRGHPWINLEWAYEVAVYLLHAVGGPAFLSFAAACAFTSAVWLLLRLIRPVLGDAGGALLGFAVVLVMQDRFAVRPEMASFPLLVGLLTILDSARRHDGRGLWRVVPLMIVWVNVHALFVIGLFAILCELAGRPSRRLAAWALASFAAVFVNPFGIHGVLLPAKLYTLIDKASPAFQSIAEFRSPFAPDVGGIAIAAYKVLLIVGVAAVVAAAALDRERRRDIGGMAFFAGLAFLSIVARRNAALFALGGSPLIARSLGALVGNMKEDRRARLRSAAPMGAVVVIAGGAMLGGAVTSGWFYRWDDQPREFGGGVLEGSFPIRAAAFVREAKLPGKLYNDIAAGGYLAWDDPIGDGVFVDGRLEVYDTAFISSYVAAMYDPVAWNAAADRYGIQTVILYHHWENRRRLIERLLADPAWSMVYADEVAVVFVRVSGNEAAIARADAMQDRWNRATHAWLTRPIMRGRFHAGRVEGTRAFARLLATLGDDDASAEEYTRLTALGIPTSEEADIRLRLARHYLRTGRAEESRRQIDRVLELAPDNREAREMLGR